MARTLEPFEQYAAHDQFCNFEEIYYETMQREPCDIRWFCEPRDTTVFSTILVIACMVRDIKALMAKRKISET